MRPPSQSRAVRQDGFLYLPGAPCTGPTFTGDLATLITRPLGASPYCSPGPALASGMGKSFAGINMGLVFPGRLYRSR